MYFYYSFLIKKRTKKENLYISQEQLTDTDNIPAQGVCSAGQYLQINV